MNINKDRMVDWDIHNEMGNVRSVQEWGEKLKEVQKRKVSVWRDELIGIINGKISSAVVVE